MKEFNLKEYLKNPKRKVVTRDKRNVRILCTDRRGRNRPIAALIEEHNNVDEIYTFTKDGKWDISGEENINDLFFVPEEGWVNLYLDTDANSYTPGFCIYKSKKSAEKEGKARKEYITTAKIEWEG